MLVMILFFSSYKSYNRAGSVMKQSFMKFNFSFHQLYDIIIRKISFDFFDGE